MTHTNTDAQSEFSIINLIEGKYDEFDASTASSTSPSPNEKIGERKVTSTSIQKIVINKKDEKAGHANEKEPDDEDQGPGSFCLPRIVVQSLLDHHASALEICAMLCLACCTEQTGQYSYGSHSVISRRTGANKAPNGPIMRAMKRLMSLNVITRFKDEEGVVHKIDHGPMLMTREAWSKEFCGPLPDQMIQHKDGLGLVKHVLPSFGEPMTERVWFSKALVEGFMSFENPLQRLLKAGDIAARLLLAMYEANDMSNWGGVKPYSDARPDLKDGVITRIYESVKMPGYQMRPLKEAEVLIAKQDGYQVNEKLIKKICHGIKYSEDRNEAFFAAFYQLCAIGFIYEVVVALDRNETKCGAIAKDANINYVLDTRSKHGYIPKGEHGLAWLTASTLFDHGFNLAVDGESTFDGTYAAIVAKYQKTHIVGLMRLRLRVSNNKNAGVKGTFKKIKKDYDFAQNEINRIRVANGMDLGRAPRFYPR